MSIKVFSERKRMTKDERASRIKVAGDKLTALTVVLPLVAPSNPLTNASDEDLDRKSSQHLTKLKSDDSVKESSEGTQKIKDIFLNMKKVYKTLNEKKKKRNAIQTLLFPLMAKDDETTITPHQKKKESTRIRKRRQGEEAQAALEKRVKEKVMDNNSTNVVNLKSMVLEKSVEKCSKYKARKSDYDHPNDKGKINMYLEPLKAATQGAESSYDHPNDRGKMLLGMPKKGKGKKKVKKAKKKAK